MEGPPTMFRRGRASALIALACGAPWNARACEPAVRVQFSYVQAAIDDWAGQHQASVTRPIRDDIVDSYCEAALKARVQLHADDDALRRVAGKVIADHLDRELDVGAAMRTISASLNSALGVAGFSRPVVRRFVRFTVDYKTELKLTELRIGDETQPARTLFVAMPGHVVIAGLASGRQVCNGSGDVSVGQANRIECK